MLDKNILFTLILSEANLIELYCNIPNILLDNAQKVEMFDEYGQFFLRKVNNGNYFIITTKNQNYLFPRRNNRHINSYEYETTKLLFDCQNYQVDTLQKFTLKQPAKADSTLNQEVWKLTEKGILNFTINSDLSELPELPLNHEESPENQYLIEEVNTQLKLLERDKTLLQERLSESEKQLSESEKQYQKLLAKSNKIHHKSILFPSTRNNVPLLEVLNINNLDLELFIRTTFTGFEAGLLLIVIISLLGTTFIGAGFWILIFGGLIFLQYRQIIPKNKLLITALATLVVIFLIPHLQIPVPINPTLSKELSILALAILSGFLALAVTVLYKLIYNALKTYL